MTKAMILDVRNLCTSYPQPIRPQAHLCLMCSPPPPHPKAKQQPESHSNSEADKPLIAKLTPRSRSRYARAPVRRSDPKAARISLHCVTHVKKPRSVEKSAIARGSLSASSTIKLPMWPGQNRPLLQRRRPRRTDLVKDSVDRNPFLDLFEATSASAARSSLLAHLA